MYIEGLRIMLLVLMFVCMANVGFFLTWFMKYANRSMTIFEIIAIITSMLCIINVITVLFLGM